MGFTKLDSRIIDSSIWEESPDVLKCFITFWCKSDPKGIVSATYNALERASNLGADKFKQAIEILTLPDPSSKSTKEGGKRIVRMEESKWLIVNYEEYREFSYSDNPDSIRRREWYHKKNKSVIPCDISQTIPGYSASASDSDSASEGRSVRKGEKKTVEIPEHLKDVWGYFLEMRKKIRKPATERAQELLLKKLFSLSVDPEIQIQIIEQSIERSWQGFFKLKNQFLDMELCKENRLGNF